MAAESIRTGSTSAYTVFDIFLVAALGIFFVGYVNIHSELLGIPHFLPAYESTEQYWEIFSWIIFGMLAIDVNLKYRKLEMPGISSTLARDRDAGTDTCICRPKAGKGIHKSCQGHEDVEIRFQSCSRGKEDIKAAKRY